MSIVYRNGNMFDANVEALVNPVNCFPIMGKGLALEFKMRYPDNFKYFEGICKMYPEGHININNLIVFKTNYIINPKYIINFPTKYHWKNKSKLCDIKDNLNKLREIIYNNQITSIAIPALGCGCGELHWNDVKIKIENILGDIKSVDIQVYEPH